MASLGVYSSRVNEQKSSFRTTIPKPVAKALKLTHKEDLKWEIKIDEKRQPYVILTPG